MTDKIVAFTTTDSEEEAQRIARALVESRLAACVNIVPRIRSIYRWKGKVEEAVEFLLVIKSSGGLTPRLAAEVRRLHAYQTPEFITFAVKDGDPAYLDWVEAETASDC